MSHSTGFFPNIQVDDRGTGMVSQAGATVLLETIRALGLDHALSQQLRPWRKPLARHDPGKIVLDQVVSLALGGDCLADIDRLRDQPGVFGQVASDPTVSRLITTLAAEKPAVLKALNTVRARARAAAWAAAGQDAPTASTSRDDPLIIDIDATLITSHSENKEAAKPTYKRGFGFHPLAAFVDHGPGGTGEPVALMLRAGNAGANTAADHISVTKKALAQLPRGHRSGPKTLIRTDSAGGTHAYLEWLTKHSQSLSYSVGFGFTTAMAAALDTVDPHAWVPAIDGDGNDRDGAWVVELTDHVDVSSWPAGLRVIVRKERPHPGAQLRITDIDGMRYTAFATNQISTDIAGLEVRHRHRARCEDRIRIAKDTGLANLPLASFAANEIWTHLVMLAAEVTAWAQMLALSGTPARTWEPKRLRARIFEIAGKLVATGRRLILHLAATAPETRLVLTGLTRLRKLTAPG